MKFSIQTLRLGIAALVLGAGVRNLDAGTPPDHSWNPSRTVNPPYGLTDLDPWLASTDYGYSSWGLLMDEDTLLSTPEYLAFTSLTKPPFSSSNDELFISTSASTLQLHSLPVNFWNAPTNGGLGNLSFIGNPLSIYYLIRKYHFSDTLSDVRGQLVDQTTKKAIILIHGWNPESSQDMFSSGNLAALKTNLQVALQKAGNDWSLITYHWEPDADSGGNFVDNGIPLVNAGINGSEAAEAGNRHGQHLGELLDELTDHKIQKVHFIAHSAGSWVARTATRYLLKTRADHPQRTPIKIQVTLLDPFIPGDLKKTDFGRESHLVREEMSAINEFYGATADSLFRLENYWSEDVALGTNDDFVWRGTDLDESGLRLDWRGAQNDADAFAGFDWLSKDPYGRHDGPVRYYGHTVAASTPSIDSAYIRGELAKRNLGTEGSLNTWGWRRSMLFNEPVITKHPTGPTQTLVPGSAILLTASAAIRGNKNPEPDNYPITYRWETSSNPSDAASWVPVTTWQPGLLGTSSYRISAVTNAQNGLSIRVVASTRAGFDASNHVTLSVGTNSGGNPPLATIPATPSNLQAVPLSSSSISLSWVDNSTNETGFRIQRKLASSSTWGALPGQTADKPAGTQQVTDSSGLVAGRIYQYQVAAINSANSANPIYSTEVSVTTPAVASTNYTLAINSTNPASGVSVYSFNTATGGSAAQAVTPNNRLFAAGTSVTISALQTLPTGQQFQKWQVMGGDDVFTPGVTVPMNANRTVTAVYGSSAPPVRTLSSLAVSGPATVNEGTSGQFTATATFSDGTSYAVTPNPWGTNFGAPATISSAGVLNAAAVTADTVVTVNATYVSGGVTKYATRDMTVRNSAAADTYTLTTSATNGSITRTPDLPSYTSGTLVVVTVTPNAGYNFVNWTGASFSTSRSITVLMDGNKTLTAQFTAGPPPGSIIVNISPAAVVTAGAQWRLDESSPWSNSGVAVPSNGNGDRFLQFKDIPGWTKPISNYVSVTTGTNATLNASYTQHAGTLQVLLQPADAITAGAQWRVDGGAWQNSGVSLNVSPGNRSIEFKAAGTWTTPASQTINVLANQATLANGAYGPPLGQPTIASIAPPNGPLAGGTAVTIEGINFAPNSTVKFGGVNATSVVVNSTSSITAFTPARASYGTVAVQVNSGSKSASVANGFTYAVPRGVKLDLLGQLGGAVNAVELAGSVAWVGEGSGLVAVDISNVSSLSAKGRIGLPDMVKDIALSGNYAYVANEDAGIQVVDVSDPNAPASRGFFDTPGQARCVTLLGGRAYVADGSEGLQILSLTNPLAITRTGGVDTPGAARWVEVVTRSHGVYALVADESNGLQVINVSNPAKPTLSAVLNVGSGAVCLGVSGNYAYVGDNGQGGTGGVRVVDITDPRAPTLVGPLASNWGNWPCYALRVNSGRLWLCGLSLAQAYDLTIPESPSYVAAVPPSLLSNSSQITASGNIGYVADVAGLKTYDISSPSVPVARGSYLSPIGQAKRHHSNASHAFVADQNQGLRCVSLSNPALPTLVGARVVTNPQSENVFLAGAKTYLCLGSAGFQTISVSNPASPSLDSTFSPSDGGYVIDFNVSGSVGAYVGLSYTTSNGRFGLFDTSNPSSPSLRGQINLSATNDYQSGEGVVIKGSYAYVANWNLGLRVVDISNINSPSLRGSLAAPLSRGVAVSGDGRYAYLASGDGFRVIDVTNPNSPTQVSKPLSDVYCFDVAVSGNLVFVAATTRGVVVFDVTNPSLPVEVASYDTAWGAWGVDVAGDVVTVSDGYGGLVTLRLADTQIPSVVITTPVFDATYTSLNSTVALAGAASDNKSIAKVLWANSRGGSGEAAGTTDWSTGNVQLYPGQNVLTVTAMDTSGNRGSDVLTVTYSPPDSTAPVVRVVGSTSSGERIVTTDTVDVSGSSTDNMGVVEVTWSNNRGGSGTATGTNTWTANAILLQSGINELTFTARDAASNTATETVSYRYMPPDTAAPSLVIQFPTLDAAFNTNTSPLSLAGAAVDDQGVTKVSWVNDRGGQGSATGTESWSITGMVLKPGLNVITVTVRDATGNRATDSIAVTYSPVTNSTRPTVSITAPVVSGRIEAETINVTGKAGGTNGVNVVLYQLNDGPWLTASGTTSWSASVQPPPGLNTLRSKSLDSVGADSLVATRTFTRVLRADLDLSITGEGTLTHPGFSSTTGLEVGKNYVLTAKPKTGHIFAGYSGSIVSEQPTITFTMQPGMAIVANFIATPFPAVAGTYLGLVQTSPPTQASSGLLRMVPTAAGSFTGTLSVGGGSHSLSGKFSSTGQWVGQIARSKKTPLTLLIMLDVANGSDTLTGLVSDGVFTSSINTHRSTFKTGNACPQQGRYTIAIDPEAGNTSAPTGYGYATFTVDANGNTVLAGKLGDGTALTSNAFVSKLGTWPLYQALYSSTGCVMGEATFAALAESDAAADLYWFKPARPSDAYYKTGFETVPRLSAQAYAAPTIHHRALPGWDAVNGLGTAGVSGAGLLVSPLTQPITLSIDNKVTSDATVLKSLVVTIVPSTGAFSGSFLHPDTKKTTKHYGVLLQKTNEGVGVILGATTTGSVLLAPQP